MKDTDEEDGKEKQKKKRQKPKLLFADIESAINRLTHKHTPTMLCIKNGDGSKIVEKPYEFDGCIDKFLADLLDDDRYENSTIVFHNFSGYDGMFLLNAAYAAKLKTDSIFRGSKILTMELKQKNIKFIDSALHIPMALSRFPKAYNFANVALKGYFPYLLVTKENECYIGPFPDISYFDPDNMGPEDYKEFKKWYDAEVKRYAANPELKYDLRAEMLKYCENDVEVLRLGFQKCRETYMEMYDGIDPADFITLPSYINHCYRTLAMPEKSMPIVPPKGYNRKHSNAAICWLEWQSKVHQTSIKHARNSTEVRIGKYFVDGFADFLNSDKENRLYKGHVWEFNGCHWHGCPCQKKEKMIAGKTMEQLFAIQKEKEKFLEDRGYKVHTIWECEYRSQLKQNDEMREFVQPLQRRLKLYTNLRPRESLRGGRTNAVRMSYIPKHGECIHYVDFTSLYPAVNIGVDGQMYPVGHPHIMLTDFIDIKSVFGLVKARIRAPDKLFMPVLPVFENGKVIYGLCAKCMTEGNTEQFCTHTDKERIIEGTFVSVELLKALEVGYEIVELIEIWHWDEEHRSNDLFKDFLKKSYVNKVEASGWPKSCKTDAQKVEYIRRYLDEQDIAITFENVKENKPIRENSKLTINNVWGFFGKDPNVGRTVLITSYAEFLKYHHDKSKEILSTFLVNEDQMMLHYKDADGAEKADGKGNIFVACFTTAHARMKLYDELVKVGERALYFDTDSIIYIHKEGEQNLTTGPLLGHLTDEVTDKYGPQAKVASFYAGGPKTYLLNIVHAETGEKIDTIMKHKGIKTTVSTTPLLNPTTLADVIVTNSELKVPQRLMVRNKKIGGVDSRYIEKRLRVTFSKRMWPEQTDIPSLPIGTRA